MADYIYMKVSIDKYEFPEAIASNIPELARKCETTETAIASALSRTKRFGSKSQFIKVDVSEEEQE